MKSRSTTAFAAVAIALSLFSGIAQARPGEGGSMGSRGSRTWSAPAPTRTSPYGAAPMERSIAPRQTPGYGMPGQSAPRYGNAPMMGQSRHPFLTGFMGGMLGAGVFGLLSGHGFLGGVHGLFGFVGLLLQIFLAVIVIRWLFALFTRNRNGGAGSAGAFPVGAAGSSNGRTAPSTLQIGAQDYQAFQTLLLNIQTAWSQQNIPALQGMATPEMVSYFNQQLGALASRGERNVVSDVRFLQGDLAEAWTENGYDYATVAIRYSLIDLTTDMTGRVVAGSSTEPVVVTELWTFVRPSSGGAWLLSAIQQAR